MNKYITLIATISIGLNFYQSLNKIQITQLVAKDQWCEPYDHYSDQDKKYWSDVDSTRVALFKSPKELLIKDELWSGQKDFNEFYAPLVHTIPHHDRAIICIDYSPYGRNTKDCFSIMDISER